MKKALIVLPIMIGWYVMGFCDLVGTAMGYVQEACAMPADSKIVGFLPSMVFVWFFFLSVPSGMLASRIGRKNTVIVSMAITVFAMALGWFAGKSFAAYLVAFALIGIGNTVIQSALPGLFANVSTPEKMTSLISFGQFTKAICSAMTPMFVWLAATAMGNWRYLFLIYGVLTVVAGVWLFAAPVPREERSGGGAGFLDCLRLLKTPFILLMFTGVFASVAADVGFNVFAKQYLVSIGAKAPEVGQTVYFVAKMAAAFVGALVFAKVNPAKCYLPTMLLALVPALAMFPQWGLGVSLALIAVIGFALANTFGIALGLALSRYPEKTTEINGLMIMAVSGGALTPPLMGWTGSVSGALAVLVACILYMLALSVYSLKAK